MQGYLWLRNRYAMRQAALAANMSHVRICASRYVREERTREQAPAITQAGGALRFGREFVILGRDGTKTSSQ
jgi:hypothetical protein